MKYILKWTNKFSGDTGFVESISSKEKHFVNTFEQKDAKVYASISIAKRMIASLRSMGEAENNDFDIIEV